MQALPALEAPAKSALVAIVAASTPRHGADVEQWSEAFLHSVAGTLELGDDAVAAFAPLMRAEEALDLSPFVAQLPPERLEALARDLILLFATGHAYDARTRVVLRGVARALALAWPAVAAAEADVARELSAELRRLRREEDPEEAQRSKTKRWMKVGLAAVGGATLLAVTGGLAAPFVLSGVAALGTTGGTVASLLAATGGATTLTAVFGGTGAGLAGYKMKRRTEAVQEFEFQEEPAPEAGLHVVICVSGWLLSQHDVQTPWGVRSSAEDAESLRRRLKAFYTRHNPAKASDEHVGQLVRQWSGQERELFEALNEKYSPADSPASGDSPGEGEGEGEDDAWEVLEQKLPEPPPADGDQDQDQAQDQRQPDQPQPDQDEGPTAEETLDDDELRRDPTEPLYEWRRLVPTGEHYTLRWESPLLLQLGRSIQKMAVSEAADYAVKAFLKTTVFSALLTALTWPLAVIKACDIIDNVWSMAVERADEAGRILAAALVERQQGSRPVSLVGFGMGARLIFACLRELAARGAEGAGIVENAVLLGTPVSRSEDEWAAARSAVAGRLVNAYSTKDWILSLMFRSQSWSLQVAGIRAVERPGVEDVDVTDIVGGHAGYRTRMEEVLARLDLEGVGLPLSGDPQVSGEVSGDVSGGPEGEGEADAGASAAEL